MTDDHEIRQDYSKPASPVEYGRIFFSGFAMGAADIVPGVSGGTMAFILGIYETLLNAIKSFNLYALMLVFDFVKPSDKASRPSFMSLVDHLHLRFLIALGLGLMTAVLLLSGLLEGWLQTHPTYIFAFFAGLIIASVIAIGLQVHWNVVTGIALLVGAVIAFFVTNPEIGTLGDTIGHGPLALFISGMIAICAMILPGISGSFILLVLGQYDFILGAVHDRDIVSVFFVAAGAGIGILLFSRILSWLLDHYYHPTIALLVGFMVGALRLIAFRMTHAAQEVEGAPPIYSQLDLSTNEMMIAFGLGVVGFLLVSIIDHMQTRSNPLFSFFNPKAA